MAWEKKPSESSEYTTESGVTAETRSLPGETNAFEVMNQNPDYVYRWVVDKDNALYNLQKNGYEFVYEEDGEKLAEGAVKTTEAGQLGSKITRPAGNGRTYFLMRIKKEWYEENQDYKVKNIKAIEAAMKPKGPNEYGEGLRSSVTEKGGSD